MGLYVRRHSRFSDLPERDSQEAPVVAAIPGFEPRVCQQDEHRPHPAGREQLRPPAHVFQKAPALGDALRRGRRPAGGIAGGQPRRRRGHGGAADHPRPSARAPGRAAGFAAQGVLQRAERGGQRAADRDQLHVPVAVLGASHHLRRARQLYV